MNKSKLLDIFRVIAPKDRRLFRKYVESPYFNKRKDVILLCVYLIDCAKENYPIKKLDNQYCWRQLFRGKKFDEKKFAYLMSTLCQLAESFLGQQNFEKQEHQRALFTLESLAKHRLEKHYQKNMRTLKNKVNSSSLEDANKKWVEYKIAEIEDLNFNLQGQRQVSPFIEEKNHQLDQFFIQKKLQLFCAAENIKKILGIKLEISWPKSPIAKTSNKPHTAVFAAYSLLYQLLIQKEADESQFLTFKSFFPFLKNKLSHDEYIDMFSYAINYCSLEFNKGNKNYSKHLFSLHEEGLAHGALLVNNELSPWIYKNIVKLGLGLKRFQWTEDFILNYSEKLPENQRKDALYFNLANLSYYQKDYNKAFDYLNQVEFTDIYYKHGAKAMLLKMYFETDETEAFFALENSFRILILRDNNIRHELKTTYLNFIRFTSKLFKFRLGDKGKLEKLKTQIEQTPNINGRNWVLGQLKEIESS